MWFSRLPGPLQSEGVEIELETSLFTTVRCCAEDKFGGLYSYAGRSGCTQLESFEAIQLRDFVFG